MHSFLFILGSVAVAIYAMMRICIFSTFLSLDSRPLPSQQCANSLTTDCDVKLSQVYLNIAITVTIQAFHVNPSNLKAKACVYLKVK